MNQEERDIEVTQIVQKTLEAERRIRKSRYLYNTRLLMEQYRDMQQHVERAISEESEAGGSGTEYLASIRHTKMKTALMIANIDRAMSELEEEYRQQGMLYKYEAFRDHYIIGKPYEQIAGEQQCGKNSPSRWTKELMKKMSVKLFGVDAIEKW